MRVPRQLTAAALSLLFTTSALAQDDGSSANATDAASTVTDTVPQVVNATLGNTTTTTCYSGVRLFVARGTLETQGESAQHVYVKQILSAIPDSLATEVVYPAAPFYFPLTFISSVLTGISNAQEQIYHYHTACPDSKIVLMGYSQGARVMGHAIAGSSLLKSGDALEPVSIPMSPLCASAARMVVAVVLFGDPGRKLGVGEDAYKSQLCNVSATYPRKDSQLANFLPYAGRLQEWCHKGDPVCCSTGQDVGDHLSYFNQNLTATSLKTVADFVADKASLSIDQTQRLNASSCVPFTYNPLFRRALAEREFDEPFAEGVLGV